MDPGARGQAAFLEFIAEELVPAIRTDCRSEDVQVIAAGASIGAYEALVAMLTRPDLFRAAVCMSGTYELTKFLEGPETDVLRSVSPLHLLPRLDGERLDALRERFVLLAHGRGRWEEPVQSWRVADARGARGLPHRGDEWGAAWGHAWPAWRAMLPQYLDELLPVDEV